MTRFSITMDEALEFILSSVSMSKGSEVFVPKIKSYKIETVKDAMKELFDKVEYEKIPVRQGEKHHETLINDAEIKYTLETDSRYIILREFADEVTKGTYPGMKMTSLKKQYSSDVVEQMSSTELAKMIKKMI